MRLLAKSILRTDNSLCALLQKTFAESKLLTTIVGGYSLAALCSSIYIPPQYTWLAVLDSALATAIICPALALCSFTLYVMIFIRPTHLVQYIWQRIHQVITSERLAQGLPVAILLPFFICSFTYFKSIIPLVHPYTWDIALNNADLIMHGGKSPWAWIQPIFGHPLITFILNFFYHLWFAIIFSAVYWAAFSGADARLRMRFLLSFILSWIFLGNVLATIFSSVGPCFYGVLSGDQTFHEASIVYLHKAQQHFPIWALNVQKMLWEEYKEQRVTLGISAMPSMHVASAVLVALAAYKANRYAGIFLAIFASIIMIGSVHLAWHYAIDGYVAAGGAFLIWHIAGYLASLSIPYNHASSKRNKNG